MNTFFKENLKKINLELTETQYEQFEKYYELLVEWNKVMNLTAITEKEDVYMKHFLDSLTIVNGFDISNVNTCIDIGTGAGFPGIPLKIAFPHLNIVLLDSLQKRLNFLNTVINELKLENIQTLHGRAEDYAKKVEHREQYDLCVSRAVANLSTLSEYCMPYVKTGGYFVPYKSGEVEEEVKNAGKALNILGGKLENTIKFELPGTDIHRSLLIINKIKNTPKKYPRKAGTPSKEPL